MTLDKNTGAWIQKAVVIGNTQTNPDNKLLLVKGDSEIDGTLTAKGNTEITGTLTAKGNNTTNKLEVGGDRTVAFGESNINKDNTISSLEVQSPMNGTDRPCGINFHRAGYYASKIVFGTDNAFHFGGWSANADSSPIKCGDITASGYVNANTPYGALTIGSQNVGCCHIMTDRPFIYFNTPVAIHGNLEKYDYATARGKISGYDLDRLTVPTGQPANLKKGDMWVV